MAQTMETGYARLAGLLLCPLKTKITLVARAKACIEIGFPLVHS